MPRFPHIATSPRAEHLIAAYLFHGTIAHILGIASRSLAANDRDGPEAA